MSDQARHDNNAPSGVLQQSVNKLLRPLIRLLISQQITYPTLIGMLKKLYVDVAEQDFQVDGHRQSDSRINLLTGVHRKDVKKLRSESQEAGGQSESASIGARIIGYWLGSDEYTDERGRPRSLPLKTVPGDPPGFDALVEKFVRQDIRPRVILDEWVRLGVARLDDDDQVVLNTGAFTPSKGFEEKVFFFGKNIRDHIDASTRNLTGQAPSYFDRSVYYDGLSATSVQELEQLAGQLGMSALTEMNKQALSKQKRDRKSGTAGYRINFGIFNYHTVHGQDSETSGQ